MGYYFDDSQSINAYEGTGPAGDNFIACIQIYGTKSKARTLLSCIHKQWYRSYN